MSRAFTHCSPLLVLPKARLISIRYIIQHAAILQWRFVLNTQSGGGVRLFIPVVSLPSWFIDGKTQYNLKVQKIIAAILVVPFVQNNNAMSVNIHLKKKLNGLYKIFPVIKSIRLRHKRAVLKVNKSVTLRLSKCFTDLFVSDCRISTSC